MATKSKITDVEKLERVLGIYIFDEINGLEIKERKLVELTISGFRDSNGRAVSPVKTINELERVRTKLNLLRKIKKGMTDDFRCVETADMKYRNMFE